MVVAGNISLERTEELANKWFGPIPRGERNLNNYPVEPEQTEKRVMQTYADVPSKALYKAYHCCAFADKDYPAADLLSDILSRSESSRLYQALVKEKQIFSDISAYMSGDLDKGLFVVQGQLVDGVPMEAAEQELNKELKRIVDEPPSTEEVQKVKNKFETARLYTEMSVLNKAMNFAFWENVGDVSRVNSVIEEYKSVTAYDIRRQASAILRESNCSTLYYMDQN
jgi:predicted Zn-dependent peptidase